MRGMKDERGEKDEIERRDLYEREMRESCERDERDMRERCGIELHQRATSTIDDIMM